MEKRVKSITVRIAGKKATRTTWTRVLRTAFEAFCGVVFAGIADVFVADFGSPMFRIGLFSLIALGVSTAVTAVLNEDQRINRSLRTFIQVFVGVIAGGVATVLADYGTPAFKTGVFSLIIVAVSTALATVMNLQPSEVIQEDKGAEDDDTN